MILQIFGISCDKCRKKLINKDGLILKHSVKEIYEEAVKNNWIKKDAGKIYCCDKCSK
jgi:hypothetical protein